MNSDYDNPYAAPDSASPQGTFNPVSLTKIEAIIKDAGQYVMAIAICIFCSALGGLIIGPWYLVRLRQWKTIAEAEPLLLDSAAPLGSVAQRFQAAKTKLIIGASAGGVLWALWIIFIVTAFLVTPTRRP